MKIQFFEPPPKLREGGLEAAIRGLSESLGASGDEVLRCESGKLAEDVDLVHFHGLWQPQFTRLAAQLRREARPYVVSPHGMLEPWAWRHKAWKKWPYFWLFERRFLLGAATVLGTAEQEVANFRRLLPAVRAEVLPLGSDFPALLDYAESRRKLGWSTDERILLYLSRIHVKKGLDLLLEALARLDCPPGTRLVVVGGGDEEYLRRLYALAQAKEANLPPIEWVGEVWGNPRWDFLAGADLFCLPTHSENFGIAVLEALLAGTPVLTTDTTPWAEHVTGDPARGFIAKPEVNSIEQALRKFFSADVATPADRERVSQWSRESFSWTRVAPHYRDFYSRIAGQAA